MSSRYEFVLHGLVDGPVVPALSQFTRTVQGDFVVLRGDLESDQGLAEVLSQFASLGLGLHSFRKLTPDDVHEATLNGGQRPVS